MQLNGIFIDNFKSFENLTYIPISDLSILLGANSSGKSTALQTLLALKQTAECNSPDVDLLLSGKYVTLGNFDDVINNINKKYFSIGVSTMGDKFTEDYVDNNATDILWIFDKSKENDVALKEINLKIADDNMKLVRSDDYRYDIIINEKNTYLSVGINNLMCKQLYINYNSEFNELFYNFLSEILKALFSDKKQGRLERKELVSIKTVERFYLELLRRGQIKSAEQNDDEEYIDKISEVTDRAIADIEKYCEYQFEYYNNFVNINKILRENLLFQCLYKNENIGRLEKVLLKYEALLEKEFAKSEPINIDSSDELDIKKIYNLGSEEKGLNSECDIISDMFRTYRELKSRIFNKIFYLGPIREKPQGLYNVGFETIPKYVGISGAYFASVLLRENRYKEYVLPNGEYEKMSLLEALDEWAAHLNVASQIQVEKKNSFGFSVSISNTQRRKSDIMNVGIGTSQVLPVLIMGLLSEEREYILFEQPELHLHPYSQSRLADFFVELVKGGRKIIVETHSEYFVLRLRYKILKNSINEKNVVINFFQNEGETKISQGRFSDYGNLQYPEDFKDETQKLLDDLMNAALEKRGQ